MVEELFKQPAKTNGEQTKAGKTVDAAFVVLPLDCITLRCDAQVCLIRQMWVMATLKTQK